MYEGNILFCMDGSTNGMMSAKWLCDWPAKVLQSEGYFVDTMAYQDVPHMSRHQKRVVDRADVIVYERHVDDPWLPYLESWGKEKRLFITLDDAYWECDQTTLAYQFWSKNNRLEKLELVASWSEKVITPSKKLSDRFPNGHFKPNRPDFSQPEWAVRPLFSDGCVVWGGTMGHEGGLREHPFLKAMTNIAERGDARFVGLHGSPEIARIIESVPSAMTLSFQPFNEWLSILSGAVVVACPLGEGYDEHRSWIKALETSVAGSVWVASDRGVYDGAGGGILVEDTVEAWEDALMYLLTDDVSRCKLMEEGRKWAWRQGLHEHLDEWEEIFDAHD